MKCKTILESRFILKKRSRTSKKSSKSRRTLIVYRFNYDDISWVGVITNVVFSC